MRVVEIPTPGEPSVFRIAERPTPEPGRGELRVRVEASGVNFTDLWVRSGLLPADYPVVPGIEVVGRVEAVGPDVEAGLLGTRVLALDYQAMGGYAEAMLVPVDWAFPVAAEVGAAAALGLGIAGMTALAAVIDIGRVVPGERVVVLAAAGGVGSMAIQVARAAGAVVTPVASRAKHDWLANHGFVDAIDSTGWTEEVAVRFPDGVDVILDGVGAASVDAGIQRLRWSGRVVSFGAAELVEGWGPGSLPPTAGAPHLSALSLAAAGRGVLGVTLAVGPERLRRWFETLQAGHLAGSWAPLIGGVWPLEEAAVVHRTIHARNRGGKFVLTPVEAAA